MNSRDNFEFILCDCYSEGVLLQHDDCFVYMSFMNYGKWANHTMRFLDRLKFAWNVICTGQPSADDIVLDSEKARLIARNLLTRADKIDESFNKKRNC